MDTYAQTFRMTSSAQDIIAYGEEVESEIRSRIEANPTESVEKYLYINTYSDSGLVIAGAKSFAAWWTDLLGAENLGLKAVQHRTDLLRRQAVKKGRGLQKFFLLFAECAEHESILLI